MKRLFSQGAPIDEPRIAAALIVSALLFLSLQDGLVKFASVETSIWQFQFLRSIANLTFIFIGLAISKSWYLIRPKRLGPVIARTLTMVVTMVFFFSGAPFLSLAEMGAGLYTYPIFMTILSVVFLKETIGIWRFAAIVVAAIGAMVIIRPGSAGFSWAQLLPVCAGFFYSVNATILRKYCREESTITMVTWAGFGFLSVSVLGLLIVSILPIPTTARDAWPFLLTGWSGLALPLIGLAVVAAFCNVAGNILIVRAYQSAELSWLAPIDYTYLILAAFWGFVMFADLPDLMTIIGMALIALAGSLTIWRQRKATQPVTLTTL